MLIRAHHIVLFLFLLLLWLLVTLILVGTGTDIDTSNCYPNDAFSQQLRIGRAVLWCLLLIYIIKSSVHPTIVPTSPWSSDFIFDFNHFYYISWSSSTLLLLLSYVWWGIDYCIHYYFWLHIRFKSTNFTIDMTLRVGVNLSLMSLNGEGSTFIFTIFHLTSIQDLSLYDDQVPILYCWY